MSRPSLLSRLFLILGILGCGFLLLSGYLYRGTVRLLVDGLHGELKGDLAWMEAQTRADPGLLEFPRADSLARAVASFKGYRVTILSPEGRVLGESHVPRDRVGEVESHAHRPEVEEARAHGEGVSRRASHTVREEMYYVARRAGSGDAILRIAAGPATLSGFEAIGRRVAAAAVLLFVVAAAVIALWVSRHISRPLLHLRRGAQDISRPLWWDAPFREADILNEAFAEYATEVQRLTGEARGERDRLLALVDRLEEGVVLLDREGRVRAANPSARRLLPLRDPEAPLEGRALRGLLRHEGLARWIAGSRGDREEVFQVDKRDAEPGGNEASAFDLFCHLRVLQPGADDPETLLTVVDVTRFRDLDRAKTDFVANASHELKTPLSSILGYSETLLEGAGDDPAARAAFLRKIHANALRLQALVQDLLNLSRLESAGVSPSVVPLRVRDFVQHAWEHHRSAAEPRGVRLVNAVPPDLTWSMEPRDLDLILGNLVGNAVRYNTPGGKVRVEWDAEARRLGVRDDGPGIPAEALSRIFERFYRSGAARAASEGTGLGLAIVKHAAARYGIIASAESVVGEGSRFLLEVPGEVVG